MNSVVSVTERIQMLAAKILATHAAGRGLCLVGGFRYRMLDGSARASLDLDYHWDGNLANKQAEVAEVLRGKLLPEVQRQVGLAGDVRLAAGPTADSAVVRTVELAFYHMAESGSRLEIPVDILGIARLDPPIVRTVVGTVFLTLSDADMIESKVLACLVRSFFQIRDALDLFLFQDALLSDSPRRLAQKFSRLSLPVLDAMERLERLAKNRSVHIRSLERLLDEQVNAPAAANLREAGGAEMVWDAVMSRLRDMLDQAMEA